MDSNDPDTVDCAFRQRLFRDLPDADEATMVRFKDFVSNYVRENIPKAKVNSFDKWISSTSYSEQRKDELREAYDKLKGGRPTSQQASHIDTFVKTEFYPCYKHARMINSRSDAFKAWSGPRFKAIEKVVYNLPQFIKHTPVNERPAKVRSLKQAGRHYYQTDFTAYESHFTAKLMDICECELYRWCLSDDRDAEFLCNTLKGKNRMRTRTGVRADIDARRMSGDMCTSLGNGFTNSMLTEFLVHEKGGKLEGFVEGDDGLFSTDVHLDGTDYANLGFTIKIEEVDDPCKASFCGMIFSESGEIIRDPRRFLMGFGWTSSFIMAGNKIMEELQLAKSLSAIQETGQCPIVGKMARHAYLKTCHRHPRFDPTSWKDCNMAKQNFDLFSITEFQPKDDTRELFSEMYGISIPAQLEIEDAIDNDDMDRVAILMPPTWEQFDYTSKYVVIT